MKHLGYFLLSYSDEPSPTVFKSLVSKSLRPMSFVQVGQYM